jgi:ribosomal protein S27AE
MSDGHLNFCKDCVRSRTLLNLKNKADYYKEYEKKRAMLPHRVEARKEYQKTESGKAAKKRAITKYHRKYPMTYAAKVIFGNAVRDGKVKKEYLCSNCGSDNQIQGHHDDYTKPLDVRWLCLKCHAEWHKKNEPVYE